jgi:hypothetical protein
MEVDWWPAIAGMRRMSGEQDGALPVELAALGSEATSTAAVVKRVAVRLT